MYQLEKNNNNRHHLFGDFHAPSSILKNDCSKGKTELRACYIQNKPNGLMVIFKLVPKRRNKD